jgi:hypothetical protein
LISTNQAHKIILYIYSVNQMPNKSRWDTLPFEIQQKIRNYNNTKLTDVQKKDYGIAATDMAWFDNNEKLYVKSQEESIKRGISAAREQRKTFNSKPLSQEEEANLIEKLRNDYRDPYQKTVSRLYMPKTTSKGGRNNEYKSKMYKKKIILGKERCVYKIGGSKKDYVKYKGGFIAVNDYIRIRAQ